MAPHLALHAFRSSAPKQWDVTTFAKACKAAGFVGAQMSISDNRDSSSDITHAIRSNDLRLIVDMGFDVGQTYPTFEDIKTPSEHFKSFELELKKISALGEVVSHINCRNSGDYRWDEATSIEYFSDILSFSAEFLEDHPHIGRFGREVDVMGGSPHHLTGISYQTCRSGVLSNPTKTRQLLEILPPIRLTSDISQWYPAVDYPLGFLNAIENGEEETAEFLRLDIVPHIDHIHAQFDFENKNGSKSLLDSHMELWRYVWERKAKRRVNEVSITPFIGDADCGKYADANDEKMWKNTLKAADQIRHFVETWSTTTGR